MVIDERTDPPLRHVIGALLAGCAEADIAVASVRLGAIDLSVAETGRVRRCRILLGRLDARSLADPSVSANDAYAMADRFEGLLRFVESGRVEIRNAALGAWLPDFSIYRGGAGDAALVGAHWFHEPVVQGGPSLTCIVDDPASIARAGMRFGELWERGHDVVPAVGDVIRRYVALVRGAAVR